MILLRSNAALRLSRYFGKAGKSTAQMKRAIFFFALTWLCAGLLLADCHKCTQERSASGPVFGTATEIYDASVDPNTGNLLIVWASMISRQDWQIVDQVLARLGTVSPQRIVTGLLFSGIGAVIGGFYNRSKNVRLETTLDWNLRKVTLLKGRRKFLFLKSNRLMFMRTSETRHPRPRKGEFIDARFTSSAIPFTSSSAGRSILPIITTSLTKRPAL